MMDAMVGDYHVYKEVWCAAIREELSYMRGSENCHDLFAVAVARLGVIVGHVLSLAVLLDALK